MRWFVIQQENTWTNKMMKKRENFGSCDPGMSNWNKMSINLLPFMLGNQELLFKYSRFTMSYKNFERPKQKEYY